MKTSDPPTHQQCPALPFFVPTGAQQVVTLRTSDSCAGSLSASVPLFWPRAQEAVTNPNNDPMHNHRHDGTLDVERI